MIRTRPAPFRVLLGLAALVTLLALAGSPALLGGPSTGASALAPDTLRDGPPPCMGYTIDDPCITPQALAECRRAVRQCGDEPVAVFLSCPLQFSCGR